MAFAREIRRLDAALKRVAPGVRNFHWGRPIKAVRGPRGKALVKLGELRGVIYADRKGDKPITDYVHGFKGRRPTLATDPAGKGLYVVRGGSRYRITERGIEG